MRVEAVPPPTTPECHCHWSGSNTSGSAFWVTNSMSFERLEAKGKFWYFFLRTVNWIFKSGNNFIVFVWFYHVKYRFKCCRLRRLFGFSWICLSSFLWGRNTIFIKIFDLTATADANIITACSNILHIKEVERY